MSAAKKIAAREPFLAEPGPPAMSETTTRAEKPAYNPLLGMLGQLATSPSFNAEAFRMIVDLIREEKANGAKEQFQHDLAAFQAECPAVPRKGRGHNNKAYARLEDIIDTTRPYLAKYGFSLTHELRQTNDKIAVVAILAHRGGHERTCSIELPLDIGGSKNIVQAHGSTTTYGKRMTAGAVMGVSTGDEDDDGKSAAAAETISDEQVAKLRALIVETNSDIAKFCAMGGVETIEDIKKGDFASAVKLLEQKRKKGA
jgi:hypothetical protein